MTIQEFIIKYKEAFSKNTPLPIAFGYSDKAVTEVKKIPRCMIGAIRKVCEGETLTLSADNVLCGGGSLYTAFAPMPDRVPVFVSEVEHYKQNKEQVKTYIDRLDICLSYKPYLNFMRMDCVENLDETEGIIFFATPDVLSGLCSWAFYDNNDNDAVCTQFASGCCSIVTFATQENKKNGRRCFIGMLDPSARPLIPKNELTFTIPTCRFKEMMDTMEQSALFQKAYSIVRKRINGEIQKETT